MRKARLKINMIPNSQKERSRFWIYQDSSTSTKFHHDYFYFVNDFLHNA